MVGGECGLPLVPLLDLNVVVPPPHIELGEEASPTEPVNDI